jgi:hypothetical protein
MRVSTAALCVLLVSAVTAGQGQPVVQADVQAFEGTWVLDPLRSGLSAAEAERRVITARPAFVQVDIFRTDDAHPFTLIYNYDGSRTTNPFGTGTAVSQLTRDERGLLFQTVFTVRDQPVTVHELLPFQLEGAELAVTVMLRVEHGYQGITPAKGATPPNESKGTRYFRKQP